MKVTSVYCPPNLLHVCRRRVEKRGLVLWCDFLVLLRRDSHERARSSATELLVE